jgi:cathepsin B
MRFIFALLAVALCHEMLVTKEYTDYLKRHVGWEVVDYEENIFRGWTIEESKVLMGLKESTEELDLAEAETTSTGPSSINWAGAACDHEVRNQGNCGSCWAFATAGMLTDRCCLAGTDQGWLAPQELVSCDKHSQGCNGGWCTWALDYVKSAQGLVKEACYPYKAVTGTCPNKCADGKDWKSSHVCNCKAYVIVNSEAKILSALASGPVTLGFGVCRSFFNYKNGNYKCDCNGVYVGLHAVLGVGFTTADSKNVWIVKNSWGASWGNKGFFNIFADQCGISGTYPNGNVYCSQF